MSTKTMCEEEQKVCRSWFLIGGRRSKRLAQLGIVLTVMMLASSWWTFSVTSAQSPDRSMPPRLGPPPSFNVPPIQRFQLSNGLPVILMEKRQAPLVQVNVVVKAGAAMDGAQKAGLASLTAAMLDEGAGARSALQLADAIDFLGARIRASADFHASTVGLHTPLSKLDPALRLLADIVLQPTFPAQELERLRKERLTTLMQWHDEPRAVASVLFNRLLYGSGHPYGRPTIGGQRALRSFTVGDLRTFHATYFRPNSAILVVVGAVTAGEILPKLEAAFGRWKAGQRPTMRWPDIEQVEKRRVFLVDKPGAAQSEIRIGRIGAPRLTEDYYALLVMNTILGGSFTSRLNQNLREAHGYSYGAFSFFAFRPLPGPFQASTAVQTAVTDKALSELMKELNGILQPVSDEELTRARNYVALRFPENFRTVAGTANQLRELALYNLPAAYVDHFRQQILALSREDVNRVARKYLDPENVIIVVVGDRQQIEKGIRALNLGPLKLMTIEDVLGKPPVLTGMD